MEVRSGGGRPARGRARSEGGGSARTTTLSRPWLSSSISPISNTSWSIAAPATAAPSVRHNAPFERVERLFGSRHVARQRSAELIRDGGFRGLGQRSSLGPRPLAKAQPLPRKNAARHRRCHAAAAIRSRATASGGGRAPPAAARPLGRKRQTASGLSHIASRPRRPDLFLSAGLQRSQGSESHGASA